MRKIAATYIFPINNQAIKNGILVCDSNGTIVEIIDTGGNITEVSGLEFYSGILVPGFVIPIFNSEISKITERKMCAAGIAAVGCLSEQKLVEKTNSQIFYQTFENKSEIDKLSDRFHFIQSDSTKQKSIAENKNPKIFTVSEFQSSIISELLQIQSYFPDTSFNEILNCLTINGARALGIDDIFGSFDNGKTPGINLITGVDFKQMQLTPRSKLKRLV